MLTLKKKGTKLEKEDLERINAGVTNPCGSMNYCFYCGTREGSQAKNDYNYGIWFWSGI